MSSSKALLPFIKNILICKVRHNVACYDVLLDFTTGACEIIWRIVGGFTIWVQQTCWDVCQNVKYYLEAGQRLQARKQTQYIDLYTRTYILLCGYMPGWKNIVR